MNLKKYYENFVVCYCHKNGYGTYENRLANCFLSWNMLHAPCLMYSIYCIMCPDDCVKMEMQGNYLRKLIRDLERILIYLAL